jgi:hypothetical protein
MTLTDWDPWVQSEVRLADRMGVLDGGSHSVVQWFASQWLLVSDVRQEARERADEFRFALLQASGDPRSVWSLFPEIPRAIDEDGKEVPLQDFDPSDNGPVTYQFELDPKEAAKVDREINVEAEEQQGRELIERGWM